MRPNVQADLDGLAIPAGASPSSASAAGGDAELDLFTLMGNAAESTGRRCDARPLEQKATPRNTSSTACIPWVAARRTHASRSLRSTRWRRRKPRFDRFAGGGKLGEIVLVPG